MFCFYNKFRRKFSNEKLLLRLFFFFFQILDLSTFVEKNYKLVLFFIAFLLFFLHFSSILRILLKNFRKFEKKFILGMYKTAKMFVVL